MHFRTAAMHCCSLSLGELALPQALKHACHAGTQMGRWPGRVDGHASRQVPPQYSFHARLVICNVDTKGLCRFVHAIRLIKFTTVEVVVRDVGEAQNTLAGTGLTHHLAKLSHCEAVCVDCDHSGVLLEAAVQDAQALSKVVGGKSSLIWLSHCAQCG